ncbi:alkaline phosphatase family protein [uncultured Ruminococcus sp.]|uniref:LTA synthase family protein n=1 Tax=uncultured Ruminococcus sp. TaxID=165186 RepID=UPI0025EF7F29|nr:alkaline phosphatase family protein [uncultured Ruminococcus sp.]
MGQKQTKEEQFSSIRAWFCSVHEKRSYNTLRFPMTNRLLLLIYPIFIVCMAELNQDKYPSKLVLFIADHPTIMLFNVLIAALIFIGALLLFRSGWFSMLLESILYMALSITELFKYNTNGNHLIMTDMKLARSLKSLTSFAYIKITPRLVLYLVICIAFILLAFWFNPRLKMRVKLRKRLVPGLACLIACVMVVTVPTISQPVYALFQLDTKEADNTFILNEKFENNGFLAFFMQTGSENLSNQLEEPSDYKKDSDGTVEQYLAEEVPESHFEEEVHPNVIEIMSESFADFRAFSKELSELGYTNLDQYYAGLDRAADMGYEGTLIVPTYASYTVRTEFELLFGLPVKSLNDPNMPQRMLLTRQQPTVPSYYKSWGYTTAYVHPFQSSFYSRKRIYGQFNFDTMIFENDFTVPVSTYGEYIDDNVVYNQIESLIASSDEPLYLHATTMQNHQPYSDGDSSDEFINYLSRIQHSADGLADFLERLSKIDEPTIVLFVGDHFPSLRGDDGIYNQLNITSENCSTLYEQKYILWNNYGLDTSSLPDQPVSTFYAPYLVMQLIDTPRDTFTQTMMNEMITEPVYSTNYMPTQDADQKLDTLTYDRILGDIVSPSALDVLPDPSETDAEEGSSQTTSSN